MSHTRSLHRFAPALLFLALLSTRPAHAVNRDMVQLQTQMQQLIDSLARLQTSNDQQMGVLKDLVQQTVDSVNKMSVTVNGMQLKLQNQSDAQSARNDQISGQVQSLNDSLDELKARMLRMEKSLTDIQNQTQANATVLGNLPGANGAGPGAAPVSAPPVAPRAGGPVPEASSGTIGTDSGPAPTPAVAPPAGAPPVADLYRAAYSDYMAGKYPLAASEFGDLAKAYPDDKLAGNAFFYLGEIDTKTAKPTAAVKSFDQVIERYPDNNKVAAAHLHKGEALLSMKQTDAGTRELRALIQRYPTSPEAAQARTRLNALRQPASARGRLD